MLKKNSISCKKGNSLFQMLIHHAHTMLNVYVNPIPIFLQYVLPGIPLF